MRVSTPGLNGKDASCWPEGPPPAAVTGRHRITDRYLPGTRLRLRRIDHLHSGDREFKLTHKVPACLPGHVQELITNTYLSAAEYDLLATLPAAVLSKTRLSVPPLGIDVFEPPLHGLIMADVEFSTDSEASVPSSAPRRRSPRSPMTPGSPEAASSAPGAMTCWPGSPSTASNSSRPKE